MPYLAGTATVPRSPHAELLIAQVRAIDGWNSDCRAADADARAVTGCEITTETPPRLEVRNRSQQALVARAAEHLAATGDVLLQSAPRCAVVVHREPWVRDGLATRLTERGVDSVLLDDGADAVGAVVIEQPDLLVVEDQLPSLPGHEVIRHTRRFSPRTLVAAQTSNAAVRACGAQVGADACFTHVILPHDLADLLVEQMWHSCRSRGTRAPAPHPVLLEKCVEPTAPPNRPAVRGTSF